MNVRVRLLTLLAACSLALAGCGGGSGSSGGGSGLPVTNATNVFLTDDLNTAYSAIWVTIKGVTLNPGGAQVYSDATGTTINLRTLRDASGARFSFLAGKTIAAGSYTSVTVVMDKTLTLVPTGATTGVTRLFKGFDATSGTATVTFNLKTPAHDGDSVVVDFNLAQWTDDGTYVTPVVADGKGPGLTDPSRHNSVTDLGTVGSLAGTIPTQTFTLTFGQSTSSVNVATTASTTIYNADGTPNATLANGAAVEVEGVWDPTTSVLTANVIRMKPTAVGGGGGNAAGAEVNGAPTNINATAGTYDVTITSMEGAKPTGTVVHVVTNLSTKFFGSKGAPLGATQFFTDLATATTTHEVGTFDATTQTLTALAVQLSNNSEKDTGAAAGFASNVSATAQTFDLMVDACEGMNAKQGRVVHVVVASSGAQFFTPGHQTATAADWFTALGDGAGKVVLLQGTYNATTSTFTADVLTFDTVKQGLYAIVDGVVQSADTTADSVTITVRDFENITISAGVSLTIDTTSTTKYLDAKTGTLTAPQFFAAVAKGVGLHAEGTMNTNGTMSATTLRLLAANAHP